MTALFLKYRPSTFSDLVGQQVVVKTLQNSLKASKPSHAYIFTGSRGTGKTSTARIFAKGLNCENLTKQGDPCNKCQICQQANDGNLLDIIEIDAASNTSVENIRDLIEKIKFSPTYARRKVYIIDEVHMLSKGAFNALLKTLEEPPDYAFFCLATTELHKVPETIISRCQTFTFGKFTEKELVDRLSYITKQEKITSSPEALTLIARKAEGGMRDAISALEQLAVEGGNKISLELTQTSLGISNPEQLENLWNFLIKKDLKKSLEIIQKLNTDGIDLRIFGRDFLEFLQQKIHNNLENIQLLQEIIVVIETWQTALEKLKTVPIPILAMEVAIVQICFGNVEIGKKKVLTNNAGNLKEEFPGKISSLENSEGKDDLKEKKELKEKKNIKKEEKKVEIDNSKKEKELEKEKNSQENFSEKKDSQEKTLPPEESQKDNSDKEEFSIEMIKEDIKKLCKEANVSAPDANVLKTSFPELIDDCVVFKINSSFFYEKVSSGESQNFLNNFFLGKFGKSVRFEYAPEKVHFKNPSPISNPKATNPSTPKKHGISIDDFDNLEF